jgi:hypothetical protein
VQGCFPSHLIFLRRHSSQARVTLRRFCRACDPFSAGRSSSSISDLMLSVGEGASWIVQSTAARVAASSSDISAMSGCEGNVQEESKYVSQNGVCAWMCLLIVASAVAACYAWSSTAEIARAWHETGHSHESTGRVVGRRMYGNAGGR